MPKKSTKETTETTETKETKKIEDKLEETQVAENAVEESSIENSELDFAKQCAIMEAVFFLEHEPLSEELLAKRAGIAVEKVPGIIEALQERYEPEEFGIELVQISGGWCISPKRALWENLKDRYGKKSDNRLSKSARETLSIIAYSQPITRAEIEALRGVSADNMIRLLLERNLIKEVGKKDVPGKPTQYGTTKEFLEYFRLNSIADLPKLEDKEIERFELAR